MIVASAILNSITFTSKTEFIVFFIFFDSPLRTKATSSLDLQKTPTLGFSLKESNSRWFFSSLID
jgi:hypothetical protein